MSASLLQKSLKLTEEKKEVKKKSLKKKKRQNYKWKVTRNSFEDKNKETKETILNNIKELEELDKCVSFEISEKILFRKFKINNIDLTDNKEEEKTVFTDKDFEEFEKEYLAS